MNVIHVCLLGCMFGVRACITFNIKQFTAKTLSNSCLIIYTQGSFKIINKSRNPVISVDIPSGISSDNGQILGIAIKADFTVTENHIGADARGKTRAEEFKDTMDETLKKLRTTRPASGHERVLYAGLAEHEDMVDRRINGIPLHKEVLEWFDHITGELFLEPIERLGRDE